MLEESKEQVELALITRSNHQATKSSALYHYVFENLALLTSEGYIIDRINTEARQAFIVKLDAKNNLTSLVSFLKDSVCTEYHLTIDKFYSQHTSPKGVNGFSYAHTTQNFHHAETKIEYCIHIYFTADGEYLNCQVKQLPEAYLIIESAIERLIRAHSQEGARILRKFLQEKSESYFRRSDEANALQQKLDVHSRNLSLQKNRLNFLQAGVKFIELIDRLNLYNDKTQDMRGVLVKKIVDHLLCKQVEKSVELSSDEPSLTEWEEEAPVKDEIDRVAEGPMIKHKDNDLSLKAIEAASLLRNKLMSLIVLPERTLTDLIKIYELSFHLRSALLELVLLEGLSKKLEKKKTSIIIEVEQGLKELPTIVELLSRCFQVGDLENFKRLYPVGESKVNLLFYDDLIGTIIFEEDPAVNLKKIAICDYLFESSEGYRHALMCMRFLAWSDETGVIGASTLARMCVADNFHSFSMLIRHGFSINSSGIIYQKKAISILKSCIFLTKNTAYVDLLLKSNVELDMPWEEVLDDPHSANYKKINSIIKNATLSGSSAASQAINFDKRFSIGLGDKGYECLINIESDLHLACDLKNYPAAKILLGASNLSSVAAALSRLGNQKGMNRLFLASALEGGVFWCSNKAEAYREVEQEGRLVTEFGSQNIIGFRVYPDQKEENGQALDLIALLCATFHARCKSSSSQEFDAAISTLENRAKQLSSDSVKMQAFDTYYAALLLLSQKGILRALEIQKFMQIFCKIGKRFMGDADENLKNKLGYLSFGMAINVAVNSKDFIELKRTSIFEYACKYVKNTPYEFKEPEVKPTVQSSEAATAPSELLTAYLNLRNLASLPSKIIPIGSQSIGAASSSQTDQARNVASASSELETSKAKNKKKKKKK